MTGTAETGDEIVTVSLVTPKPGRIDEFIEIQTSFQKSVAGRIEGLLGGRLLRSEDGQSLIIMSRFKTHDDLARWSGSELFAGHMARVRPLLAKAHPSRYTAIWRSGDV
ncbi:antibiotic biosynthesis monooxygenase [Thalassospira xianhensis]|uniref:ABM domain-containing protein n=1 Tax=Thalassospira xianhensis MCCC 1A02616 TaxID=1177929 RepID=A0A367U8L7_9PROT|nr:antibiotic biosynthesis monooxygenase [Thalassospira xianhensis]RCK04608.1 hypothetical protein TH5_18435 [Thalassospira xianhensis MCCC 1A02616]